MKQLDTAGSRGNSPARPRALQRQQAEQTTLHAAGPELDSFGTRTVGRGGQIQVWKRAAGGRVVQPVGERVHEQCPRRRSR